MRHWRGRVAGFLAGLLLGGWLIATPAAQSYVWGAINGIPYGPGLVLSGPILAADGSAAAPVLAFASDTNTGLYRITSDYLGFAAGGVLYASINGNGLTLIREAKIGWAPASDPTSGPFLTLGRTDKTLVLAAPALATAEATGALSITQAWNTTGAPVFEDKTITNTASDAASLAFRWRGGTAGTIPIFQGTAATGLFTFGGLANGQATGLKHATASITCASGATCTAANLIPAGSMVVGVSVRVTTLITGATSISIGDGTDADRWGTGIAVAAGTTTTLANTTIASPVFYTAATGVVLTAAGSDFTAGVIRVTVHYIDLTAATS